MISWSRRRQILSTSNASARCAGRCKPIPCLGLLEVGSQCQRRKTRFRRCRRTTAPPFGPKDLPLSSLSRRSPTGENNTVCHPVRTPRRGRRTPQTGIVRFGFPSWRPANPFGGCGSEQFPQRLARGWWDARLPPARRPIRPVQTAPWQFCAPRLPERGNNPTNPERTTTVPRPFGAGTGTKQLCQTNPRFRPTKTRFQPRSEMLKSCFKGSNLPR